MLTKHLFIAAACVALLFSCSKKADNTITPTPDKDTTTTNIPPKPVTDTIPGDTLPSGGSNKLVGEWRFVKLIEGSYTYSVNPEDSTMNYTNYGSYDNAGTFRFTADSLITDHVTWKEDLIIYTVIYRNGVLYDSVASPQSFTAVDVSTTATYKIVNDDSIHTHVLKTMVGNEVSGGEYLQGYRISWAGDTLVMTSRYDTAYTGVTLGLPYRYYHQSFSTRKFVKK